jgi:hypothetical protein
LPGGSALVGEVTRGYLGRVPRPRLLCAWLLGAGACVHVDSPLPPPDPPAEHTRCERLHPIADVAVWGELKSADPVDLTPIGEDAVMIHLADPKQGRIGQLLVDLADKSTELRASWATGDERRLYIEPYLNTEDERWRLLVRDRFDSGFVRIASETTIADRHPQLAPGSEGWGLTWGRPERRPYRETQMFAVLDAEYRVHDARRVGSGEIDETVAILGLPLGYALAYVEAVRPYRQQRLSVVVLDHDGEIRTRVVVYEGDAWVGEPRLALTSDGLTVIYTTYDPGDLVRVRARLGLDGQLLAPPKTLDLPGDYASVLTGLVTHRDETWFAATEHHCSGDPRKSYCTDPPEAFAVHLAPDATVTSYDLLEVEAEMDFLRDDSDWLGDILVASVGDRLVLAWAYEKRYRALRVAELRCPANAALPS